MKIQDRRKRLSVTASVAFITMFLLNALVLETVADAGSRKECPDPFPKTYKAPIGKKYTRIRALGIKVRVPTDHQLVYVKGDGDIFRFMSPPEYKSYKCSLAKNIKYTEFYSYPSVRAYSAINNPQKLPLSVVLRKTFKDTINLKELGRFKINGIDFLTTRTDVGDPASAWFVSKSRPDKVIQYSFECDCSREFEDLKKDLSNVENL
jgi:hypothetical protein